MNVDEKGIGCPLATCLDDMRGYAMFSKDGSSSCSYRLTADGVVEE